MANPVLCETAEAFLEHLAASGKKERTVYTYRQVLAITLEFFGKDRPLSEILVPQVGKEPDGLSLTTLYKSFPEESL